MVIIGNNTVIWNATLISTVILYCGVARKGERRKEGKKSLKEVFGK